MQFKIRVRTRNQRTSTIASRPYKLRSLNARYKTLILNGSLASSNSVDLVKQYASSGSSSDAKDDVKLRVFGMHLKKIFEKKVFQKLF